MNLAHEPTKVLVTGQSGSGKTTFWTRFVVNTPARIKFVYDHEGECSYRAGINPARTIEELGRAAGTPWCVFDPATMFPGDAEGGWRFFCDFAFSVSNKLQGRKLLCTDELQKITDTHKLSKPFATVLETGRRYELDCAFIAQQPNLLHNRVRNQLTEVVSFLQLDHNAIGWLEGIGFDGQALPALRPGAFLTRNLRNGTSEAGRVF